MAPEGKRMSVYSQFHGVCLQEVLQRSTLSVSFDGRRRMLFGYCFLETGRVAFLCLGAGASSVLFSFFSFLACRHFSEHWNSKETAAAEVLGIDAA